MMLPQRILQLLLFTGALLLLTGCYAMQYGNPSATYFYNASTTGFHAESYGPEDRTGKACATSIMAMIATGDASIQAAAAQAGITRITSVSHEAEFQAFVMQKYCTIVRGR